MSQGKSSTRGKIGTINSTVWTSSSDLTFVRDGRDLSSVLRVIVKAIVRCKCAVQRQVLRLFERFDHDVHDGPRHPTHPRRRPDPDECPDRGAHAGGQGTPRPQGGGRKAPLLQRRPPRTARGEQRGHGIHDSEPECCHCTTPSPLRSHPAPGRQDMEEPFQEVKGRQPRKCRPSVASLEDQAVEPGPSHGPPSAEVPKKAKKSNPQAPQANPNRPAPAQNKPPAENKIPPIIIRDAAKWASVSSAMTTRQIKFSKAKTCIDGIRVNTVTVDDFRALTRLLEERKVPYHSFALPEQKTLRAVLRTVPCEIAIDDV
jgi:hypothetical protein